MRKINCVRRMLNKALLIVTCFLSLSSGALATTVTMDGILSSGEYTGDNSGTKSLLWWNEHHSIYTKDAANMNDLHWEINGSVSGDESFSLNLFFEVPTYARRMIWISKDEAYEYDGTNSDDIPLIPKAYLDAYLTGARDEQPNGDTHHDTVKMDYETQTGSEYFLLNDEDGEVKKIKWQAEDGNGLDDDFTWKTSREYLINAGTCSTDECLEFNRTASIEMMWQGFDTSDDAFSFMDGIADMELHLSDEARGLPDPVPEPVTMLLFGSGLIGLVGSRLRKKKK